MVSLRSMKRILVVRTVRPETAHSAEFSYLRSFVLDEVRAAFDRPIVLERQQHRGLVLDRACEAVLFLADDRILIERPTLQAMRDRIEQGAAVVCPRPLAKVTCEPLYSLRDFERAQQAVLAAPPPSQAPASHLPVSLWSLAAAERAVPDLSLDRLLEPSLLRTLTPMPPRAWAGLYHEFIDYYAEVRADILPFVPPGAREVLEIGCGRGLTGRLLRERLGCRVTGVELNPVAAEDARANLDRVLSGDIEAIEIEGRYDLIVALELFEHLVRQEAFLDRMRELLNPGGAILLSVPNVGHYSVVRDLLAGRWDYLPIGLLCFTHYRFFTRATLENWFRRAGFSKVQLEPQTTELPAGFETLAAASGFDVDLESLSTKGFYAVLQP
jgi:SAM-dependent methyltransferase